MRTSRCSPLLISGYRLSPLKKLCIAMAYQLEGGAFYSATVRKILADYHGVIVGAYSYGECLKPGAWPAGVRVGRYASIAGNVTVLLRNHPLDRLTTHPFFFNSLLGVVERDTIPSGRLEICSDVWIGRSAIILPRCGRIGIGAVIGAGAVVTRDVPDFAVMTGVPAAVRRYRFTPEEQERILQGRWWERSIEELVAYSRELTAPLNSMPSTHPLLRPKSGLHGFENCMPGRRSRA